MILNKKITLVIVAVLLISLTSCKMSHEKVIDTLPDYFASFEYLDPNGFRDYTYYCKYYYKNIDANTFDENEYFKIVSDNDIENILSFINEYERTTSSFTEVQRVYDFNKKIIEAGDFFYIYTMEGEKSGAHTYEKFEHYDVYYFDISEQILYYFHNN